MKTVIEQWSCDLCKKPVENEKKLSKVVIPSFALDCEGRSSTPDFKHEFEICEECKNLYLSVVSKNFAHITTYGNDLQSVHMY